MHRVGYGGATSPLGGAQSAQRTTGAKWSGTRRHPTLRLQIPSSPTSHSSELRRAKVLRPPALTWEAVRDGQGTRDEDKGGETNDHNTLESVISPLAAVAEVEASDKCGGTD